MRERTRGDSSVGEKKGGEIDLLSVGRATSFIAPNPDRSVSWAAASVFGYKEVKKTVREIRKVNFI